MKVAQSSLPAFVVCEDGHEYSERFGRTLGSRFTFLRAGCWAEAQVLLTSRAFAGLLLDLDFRRTPAAELVDEGGARSSTLADEARRRLTAVQGILVLRALRTAGVTTPALLFADLEDRGQVAFLESSLAPVTVVSSRRGLDEIAALLTTLAGGAGSSGC